MGDGVSTDDKVRLMSGVTSKLGRQEDDAVDTNDCVKDGDDKVWVILGRVD